jgi:3-oxoacyl-[acyl-carrier protein] reductase
MSMQDVAVISGGSRGLGRHLVEDFLARDYIVATYSRALSPAMEACRERYGDRFLWQQVDGGDSDAVVGFARQVIARFGQVDVLINNAGSGSDGILTTMRPAAVHQLIALNLASTIDLTSACLKPMLAQGRGTVVSITSVNGLRGHTGVSVYSATKAGVDGFTRSLAREVGPAGIRVNSVAPGYFESDMTERFGDEARRRIVRRTPLGRLGTSSDILGAVRFLVSPEAGFITGQTIVVDGGLSC